jgi:hypothetical protein
MRDSIPDRSPAMVVALVALFVSLGGVSYAVATGSIGSRAIRDGSLQGRDIKNGSLLGRDVKAGSLRGRNIRNASLLGRDVKDGSLQGRDIHTGTVQSRDIRDGALRGVDVNDRSLGGVDLAPNTLGDREIVESQLKINRLGGVDAGRYVRNLRQVQTTTANDATTPKAAPLARCPEGKRLVGGGARIVSAAPAPVALSANGPDGEAWTAAAYATAPSGSWQLVSVAICG